MLRHRGLVINALLFPGLFLAIPFAVVVGIPAAAGPQAFQDPKIEQMIRALRQQAPELAGLGEQPVFHIYLFGQFLLLLLLVPVMGAMTIATHSVIGEKQNRSLEPLLATPVTAVELLLGKCLAAAIPSVLVGWVTTGLYSIGVYWLGGPDVFAHVFNRRGLAIVGLIAPLMAVLSLALGVAVSSRANDPRSAQQVAVLVVLPVIGVMAGQLTGLFFLGLPAILVIAAGLAFAGVVVLGIAVQLFQRETILTRWK